MADASDSKSDAAHPAYRFKSGLRHFKSKLQFLNTGRRTGAKRSFAIGSSAREPRLEQFCLEAAELPKTKCGIAVTRERARQSGLRHFKSKLQFLNTGRRTGVKRSFAIGSSAREPRPEQFCLKAAELPKTKCGIAVTRERARQSGLRQFKSKLQFLNTGRRTGAKRSFTLTV